MTTKLATEQKIRELVSGMSMQYMRPIADVVRLLLTLIPNDSEERREVRGWLFEIEREVLMPNYNLHRE